MKQFVTNRVKVFTYIFLSAIFVTELIGGSAPVIPNEVLITGVVSEYAILSSRLIGVEPDQTLYKLTIYIESSMGIENSPNFLKEKQKQDVEFYSKNALSPELFGQEIKAKVKYRGNEKGGIFWIIAIE